MQIVIAGGTGTIGRRLVYHLLQHGHVVKVVSRQPFKPANLPAKIIFAQWDGKSAQGWGSLVDGADAVVNLAGAGIADEAWTEARKKEIQESRVKAGQAIVEAISAASAKPKVLIQSSAVGYYGVQNNDKVLTEDHPPANDFLGRTCQDWEASTAAVEALGVRRVVIRSGVVLDMQGGALPRMVLPFRFFAGGPIGSGQQWFPWIHYCDEVEAIRFLIQTEAASGPFNLTAPNPVRSRELAKAIGKVMKRPAFAPAPAFAFKTMFGEMSTVLLDGQQAIPKRLQELGYQFRFSQVEAALRDLLA
ncbi:MAG: TIGR01777 family oxidoreductase [Anaerolineae bacterium]|nr:TIGR01777 family protein [Anaerolineales bacterium]MCQ3977256.1 TIGR01777 family protein [Anaerolineae bacterium]